MQKPNAISAFDVIGPIMIGPSSSHTAGALRLASLARSLAGREKIVRVRFTLYESFARTYRGHGTDRALLAGIMGMGPQDVRIRSALEIGRETGLDYDFIIDERTPRSHPNTVDIEYLTDKGRQVNVRGRSIGGGQALITRINGTTVEFTGEYHCIIVNNHDRPGVVAAITELLAHARINIAFMRLYRESKGDMAFTFIECDEEIPDGISRKLSRLPDVERAIVVPALSLL